MKHLIIKYGLLATFLFIGQQMYAQNYQGEPVSVSQQQVLFMLGVIAFVLLFVILSLIGLTVYARDIFPDNNRKEAKTTSNTSSVLPTIALFIAFMGTFSLLSAQTPAASDSTEAVSNSATQIGEMIKGNIAVFDIAFWVLIVVILTEIFIIGGMVTVFLNRFYRVSRANLGEETENLTWWERFNALKSLKEEGKLQMEHEYDGIRELDNSLPPWWVYSFYISILFAAVYLWRYHVTYSAPLSEAEFKIAVAEGEAQKNAYLKKMANAVDETNVTLLTSAADLAAGKKLFTSNTCHTCHGMDGSGIVNGNPGSGPNLTDEYWLNGGDIKDVFKTIKYGVTGKGMIAWKDNFSGGQIAQIASYVKSLKGSNPAVKKDPQGELYTETEATVQDSTKK